MKTWSASQEKKKKLNAIKWELIKKRKVKIDGCQKQISRMMDAQNGSKEMQTRTRQEQQEQNAKG